MAMAAASAACVIFMIHSPLRVSLIHRPYQVRPLHFDQGRGPVTDIDR